ncbi:MAG: lipid-A-disaccharide synthase [Cyanobacteria bacterium]|nr:lipid-A-disaccharide synthase [Cyanobacteria bacterium CG_2015-16_32_12]NCO78816.1 lipid-A-disaccharide synthase [Cyanobacteria bacterium CG_2015-22_32_23]NCQ05197.1 lipid-A-disaccharide synthase [Cyanobacteria bacterium CG_2015-09_32_10]NCQ41368.1 lipid-A-disaccharide synthase [Cyanobacteria bacterium CG_2015-04_32_10]NCS85895.1 lipid-A-disaccharide synthase [Cyanobacteria bacterium CG_2015-02_32_10]
MRIFVSTGEVSGDLQGGLLVEALYRQGKILNIPVNVEGLGGKKMQCAGANIIADTTAIGSVGLLESLPFIIPTWKIQQQTKKYLEANLPDIIVLIDYLGPNLAIASYVKQKFPKIPIIWYIGPQFWVWTPLGQNVKQLVAVTDKLLAIFPEEAKFYQEKGLSSTYVGHPLVDRIKNAPKREEARKKLGIQESEKMIVLLPASRQQELKYLLPVMLESAGKIKEKIPSSRFYLPISLSKYRLEIENLIKQYSVDITLFEGETLDILAGADLAITKSGTVNLELGLLNIPQVVIYKVNAFTIWIARKILRFSIPFMSPVNLVLMKEIVPELLQEKATADNIINLSLELLFNESRQQKLKLDYENMIKTLDNGVNGVSDKVAQEIIQFNNQFQKK